MPRPPELGLPDDRKNTLESEQEREKEVNIRSNASETISIAQNNHIKFLYEQLKVCSVDQLYMFQLCCRMNDCIWSFLNSKQEQRKCRELKLVLIRQ